ncbi:hypothetical protein [Endozoicomonas elysicola]|uniref:Uncharacterized protein n=1 Tax=Endozoicomonas elysicola TaxID=305900 RepID=A0A081K7K6_9GAMM|nr:hypothetical protein [Endozoicomonas elysicola]KEI70132.1 hypothetical protein GV64_04650 [Endozoicomonas elysicola]
MISTNYQNPSPAHSSQIEDNNEIASNLVHQLKSQLGQRSNPVEQKKVLDRVCELLNQGQHPQSYLRLSVGSGSRIQPVTLPPHSPEYNNESPTLAPQISQEDKDLLTHHRMTILDGLTANPELLNGLIEACEQEKIFITTSYIKAKTTPIDQARKLLNDLPKQPGNSASKVIEFFKQQSWI